MTEFTAEWIKQWRFLNTPIKDTFCISALIFSEALDEIERLQARVKELEEQIQSLPDYIKRVYGISLSPESEGG